jgi:hypothetical protein
MDIRGSYRKSDIMVGLHMQDNIYIYIYMSKNISLTCVRKEDQF